MYFIVDCQVLVILSMLKSFRNLIKYFSSSATYSRLLEKGNNLYVAGDYRRALKFYQKILKQNPEDLVALYNYATACFFLQDYNAAKLGADTLIKLFPEKACGWSLRGRILLEEGGYSTAVVDLQRAVELDSSDYWNSNYLSQALQKCGRRNEAAKIALQAVNLSGGDDSQHLNMAYTLYENSLEDGTSSVFEILQQWYNKYQDNPIVKQSWKSFFFDKNYDKSDSHYVEKVFDCFADSFDETLHDLEYDSPRQIAKILSEKMNIDSAKRYNILDLGCGTGLCGKVLDSLFKKRFMTGVDLSGQMLKKACAKKCYDHLEKAEIEQYLKCKKDDFDLIVAADVVTYFGSLDELFYLVFSALKNGGYFAFSVTKNDINENDYFLHSSGRFIHAENYLKNVLQKNGFRLCKQVDSFLRKEGEKDVRGWIILAHKKA